MLTIHLEAAQLDGVRMCVVSSTKTEQLLNSSGNDSTAVNVFTQFFVVRCMS